MPTTTAVRFGVNVTQTKPGTLNNPENSIAYAKAIAMLDGFGTSQADKAFYSQRTLGISANEDLDLAGTLVDGFGTTLTIVKLKVVVIFAALTNTNSVLVSRGATNGVPIFTAVSSGVAGLGPGGLFVWANPTVGVTVTAGTGDLINVANGGAGTSVIYDVCFIGTSA